jgi:hypothetical protein
MLLSFYRNQGKANHYEKPICKLSLNNLAYLFFLFGSEHPGNDGKARTRKRRGTAKAQAYAAPRSGAYCLRTIARRDERKQNG